MSSPLSRPPEVLPMLARGKHRSPRKGACFMELASYLAGERWSDHPSCTHPLLAALARHVNDRTSDAGRPMLAPLIPSVIGLAGDDPRVDVRIALRCATAALPVTSQECQRVMAISVLLGHEVLAEVDGAPPAELAVRSREALDAAPHAERWARDFRARVSDARVSLRDFRKHSAPRTVACAVEGLAGAPVQDSDRLLRDLLSDAIEDCRDVLAPPSPVEALDPGRWSAVCRPASRG